MAVFEQGYRRLEGAGASTGHRIGVLIRYTAQELIASRAFLLMFMNSFLPTVLGLLVVYVPHNATLKTLIPREILGQLAGEMLYHALLGLQLICCTMLLWFFGPKTLTRDLVSQGLVLLLAQPLARWEYLLARWLGLLAMGVGILPGSTLLVFAVQAGLEGWAWTSTHLHILGAILICGLVFQSVMSLLVMAAAVLARDAMTALAGLVAVFLTLNGLGMALSRWLELPWLVLLSLPELLLLPQKHLLGRAGAGDLSLSLALLALLVLGGGAGWLVWRRLKAVEVHS